MPTTADLDRIDFELLRLLQNDARISNKELAAEVGLAPSSCLARVRRLTESGVIQGFHAELSLEALGRNLQAVVSIRLGHQGPESFTAIREHLASMDEVLAVFQVAGRDDFLVHVAVRDTRHLQETVVEHVTALEEVSHVETTLVFQHRAVRRAPGP
ncbi:MAG: Lrp/AsnC family transcriptional regulator [Acidobacteriota bacterium]